MAQKENAPLNLTTPELAAMGKKRIEDFVNVQTELLNTLQETNRKWFDRMQSEANLASELATKVMGARSVPDAMAVWQEWATRHFEMMAEDGKRVVTDTQKVIETGTRLFSNGWSGNGRGGLSAQADGT